MCDTFTKGQDCEGDFSCMKRLEGRQGVKE